MIWTLLPITWIVLGLTLELYWWAYEGNGAPAASDWLRAIVIGPLFLFAGIAVLAWCWVAQKSDWPNIGEVPHAED
jgi:hypothetical protein